jgi:hypothetical protein
MLAAAICLYGCAGESIRGTWQEGVPRNETFSRVLVVGVGHNYDVRCDFEYAFASQLKSAATQVFSSCDSMTPNEPLSRANIERVIASVHADAVLTTLLVSDRAGERQGNTWDTRGFSEYKVSDYGWDVYGLPVAWLDFQTVPPLTTFTESVHLVTKLYRTSDAKLLYTLNTQTKSQETDSTEDTLISITAPIANRLRLDGLIR